MSGTGAKKYGNTHIGNLSEANSASISGAELLRIYEEGASPDEYQSVSIASLISSSVPPNNLSATTDPTVNNDISGGYVVGSIWINTTTDESYRCVDSTDGAAVWVNTSLTTSDLASVAVSGDYNDLSNTPTLATVATSGDYNDLINKPSTGASSQGASDILNTSDGSGGFKETSFGFTSSPFANNFYVNNGRSIGANLPAGIAFSSSSDNITIQNLIFRNDRRISNLLDPTAAQDAATKAYVDANAGGVAISGTPTANQIATWSNSSTIQGTNALTGDFSITGNLTGYRSGPTQFFKFTGGTSGSQNTLDINGNGAAANGVIRVFKNGTTGQFMYMGNISFTGSSSNINTQGIYSVGGDDTQTLGLYHNALSGEDTGTVPLIQFSAAVSASVISTRPHSAGYNYTTKLWQVNANGNWDYQANNLLNIGTIGATGARVSQAYFTNHTTTNAETVDSDLRLKKNITSITSGLEVINQIRAVSYNWKDESRGTENHFGVIAQELQQVLPDLVHENEENLTVAYTEIIPFLIKAIQEQSNQIKTFNHIVNN